MYLYPVSLTLTQGGCVCARDCSLFARPSPPCVPRLAAVPPLGAGTAVGVACTATAAATSALLPSMCSAMLWEI
eukprot:353706-Chlamydomonas_euryale.AAC.6